MTDHLNGESPSDPAVSTMVGVAADSLDGPPAPKPKVVAVIATDSDTDAALATLESLGSIDYSELGIVVVANGSDDGPAQSIREWYPEATILPGAKADINAGVKHALRGDADYLLVVANDVDADSALVRELVEVGESNRFVGCVGAKIFADRESDRLWSTGGVRRARDGVMSERGRGEEDNGQYETIQAVDFIGGHVLLVRRQALELVGSFDRVLGAGARYADWCMRMASKGYRCAYTPHAIAWRRSSGDEAEGPATRDRALQEQRDTAVFVQRYGSAPQRLGFVLATVASMPFVYLGSLVRGEETLARAGWKGFIEGLAKPGIQRPPLGS